MAFRPQNGIDLASQRIVNLADPSAATDAVTRQYVDNALNGLSWKQPVRVATTAAGTLTTSFANGQTVDGVTLTTGMRILVMNQATGTENGIYVVAASGAPTRATDADSTAELQNATVYVVAGTVNADKAYTQTANDVVVGTTSLVFAQVGGGTAYTAGNGLSLSSGTFSVSPKAGGGLTVDGTGVYLDPTIADTHYTTASTVATAGTATTYTHNLGSLDVTVTTVEVSTGQEVFLDPIRTGVNTITLTSAAAVTAGQFRVIVRR